MLDISFWVWGFPLRVVLYIVRPLGENQLFLWEQLLEIVSGTKPGPLQEQLMLWTTELFLQSLFASFYKWHLKAYKWKLTESFVFSKPSLFETLLLAIAMVSTRHTLHPWYFLCVRVCACISNSTFPLIVLLTYITVPEEDSNIGYL